MFLATFTLGENDKPDLNTLPSEGSAELPPVGIGAQPARLAAAAIRLAANQSGLRRIGEDWGDFMACCRCSVADQGGSTRFVSFRDWRLERPPTRLAAHAPEAYGLLSEKFDIFTGKRGQ